MKLYQCVNPITNFPNIIECLEIESCKFNTPVFNFSDNLKHLILNNCDYQFPLDNLPHNLINFELIYYSNEYKYTLDHLPQGLQKLSITGYYNNSVDNLPNTLREFTITVHPLKYNSPVYINLDMLPDSIEILIIKTGYCRITKLPANIKDLQMYKRNPDYDVLKEKFPNAKYVCY